MLAKLAFEGLEVKCIREHNEYDPLTHKAVLLNVGPLLRGKDGSINVEGNPRAVKTSK